MVVLIEINYDYVNAIFIPRRDFRDSHSSHWQSRFLGFSNADSIVRQLRQQLLAIDRPHIEQCQTQRAWLTHASRIWDMITKSSQVSKYFRITLSAFLFVPSWPILVVY
jgi:hypothetical protein